MRCDWLQTTAEHDVVWSTEAGACGELSCAHLNGKWQFHEKYHELIVAFWLVRLTEHEVLHVLSVVISTRQPRSAAAWLPDNCTVLWILFSRADCRCFQVSNPCRQFTQQPSCTILLWQIKIFNQSHCPVKFAWFCLILLTVSQGKLQVH